MARYIDADALMTDLDQTIRVSAREENSAEMRGIRKVLDRIKAAPTISPDEVRGVGKWICDPISTVSPVKEWYCSICKQPAPMGYGKAYVKTRFCPSCGARMKGAEDGTTDN